jgi:hypothetical protein
MALLIICVGYFMVINVAVSAIGHDLHAGVSTM